jgi:hypothetical protein
VPVGLPDGHRAELVAVAPAAAITILPRQRTRSLAWTHGPDLVARGDLRATRVWSVHSDAAKVRSSELKRSGSSQNVACPTFG